MEYLELLAVIILFVASEFAREIFFAIPDTFDRDLKMKITTVKWVLPAAALCLICPYIGDVSRELLGFNEKGVDLMEVLCAVVYLLLVFRSQD